MYFVNFTETAIKHLKKINKHKSDAYIKLIKESLKDNPTQRGKFYGRSAITNLLYFEKKIYTDGGLRFYYTINDGVVIVSDVEYLGQVNVDDVSNKNTQTRVTKRLGL